MKTTLSCSVPKPAAFGSARWIRYRQHSARGGLLISGNRRINLSDAVALGLYATWRQHGFAIRKELGRLRFPCLWILMFAALPGCGTLPSGSGWGENATIAPGWDRVRQAAVGAARDPLVWGPLLGAAMLQVDDWDKRISDWASDHTPVFGSQQSAKDWSSDLRTASKVAYHVTTLATPSGETPGDWLINKAKGYAVGAVAIGTTTSVTGYLKSEVGRERPNNKDNESFPSGDTSKSSIYTRLASRNLRSIDMSANARDWSNIGLGALTVGTAWSRVEAKAHYPSDTLFSITLGNFFGAFFNDAFLGLDNETTAVWFERDRDAVTLRFSMRFP